MDVGSSPSIVSSTIYYFSMFSRRYTDTVCLCTLEVVLATAVRVAQKLCTSIIMWETTVQNLNGKPNYTIIFMCQVFGGVLGGHHKQLYKGLGTKALSF